MIDLTQEDIMKNWGVDNSDNPLVSIKCMTFNHEKYIAQCIEGFLIQKTNFPFEILIHDDCSTDKTESIVREYEKRFPKIIKGLYETENQWQKGCGAHHTKIDAAIKGKYIAICEGDDYWIDENKLQMQVDFLENNPEYGMCYTKAKQYIQSKQKFNKKSVGDAFDGFEDLLKNGNRIPTLTTVYRKDLLDKYQKEIQPSTQCWLMGDYPMWLYFAHESKIKFFDKDTAVYRVLENSASHSIDVEKQFRFEKNVNEIQSFFSNLYSMHYESLSDEIIYFGLYVNLLTKEYNNEIAKKMRSFFRCIKKRSLKTFILFLSSYSRVMWYALKKIRGV